MQTNHKADRIIKKLHKALVEKYPILNTMLATLKLAQKNERFEQRLLDVANKFYQESGSAYDYKTCLQIESYLFKYQIERLKSESKYLTKLKECMNIQRQYVA